MPYFVHCLDCQQGDPPRYVRATPRVFETPEAANAYAAQIEPERRALVTTNPSPPPMEDDTVGDSVS
ncbi:hypothetical protein NK718_12175 [Alsobacter sp. SYSU M60028]|uniref:Zinc ribbon domain-containing protein n=1 Tax=Alsobacter ponti TaxID=2962936 RepID=A0ABT1LCR4_9HYPH|nr:hypothetical protein [Alsobacter ponti]MCP8939277.1 hypothetical protein [Alsobacter ponti]